jgi:hypothetical protein
VVFAECRRLPQSAKAPNGWFGALAWASASVHCTGPDEDRQFGLHLGARCKREHNRQSIVGPAAVTWRAFFVEL